MAEDLPNDFDVIVLGTGLPESILAAAFSRIGLKVLHIDRNDYYSANWASFNLQGIEKWKCEQQTASCYTTLLDEEKLSALLKTGEKALELPRNFPTIFDAESSFHVGERPKLDPVESNIASTEPEQGSAAEDVSSSKLAAASEASVEPPPLGDTAQSSKSDSKDCVEELGVVGTGADTEPGQFDSASEDDAESEKKIPDGDPAQAQGEGSGNASDQQSDQKQTQQPWFADDIQTEWRRFSLDLTPKLLYCAGSMVELLIASDVAKYCEFRTVSRVLTVRDNKLEKVPCSRSDVFASKAISLPEKRLLMKFLTFAAEYEQHAEEFQDFLGQPFVTFLSSKKLSPKIQHFVLHSIAMATHTTTTEQGLASTQKFLRSLGRYGNTAFLFPLYGSGELSAVFGGCYVLTLSASHIIVNEENRCVGVVTSAGQRIDCKYLIADPSYVPETFCQSPAER
ncbi:hypothetical protein BaRGS_00004931 [Batillaria attramentaria]|uniref:Rab proteins geranylgeranyltransferase component A n=1 Tax=Batillaria attramentaria TaxID=370345 RepID=A0ABD0LXG0_9CAEN